MHRRLSAILAALALAQFSLGGAVARCPSREPSSHDMQAPRDHSPVGMRCQNAETRANANAPTHGGTPSCDPLAQGACVGMTSCSPAIASAKSDHIAAVIRADQIRPHVLDLLPGRNRSPEPPPPRT
jgi:hypothetical protein